MRTQYVGEVHLSYIVASPGPCFIQLHEGKVEAPSCSQKKWGPGDEATPLQLCGLGMKQTCLLYIL